MNKVILATLIILGIVIPQVVLAAAPPAITTSNIVIYGATSFDFVEILLFAIVTLAVSFRTWEGWHEYKLEHPDAKFNHKYVKSALFTSFAAFLALNATPPIMFDSATLLVYCVTVFLTAYSWNEMVNNKIVSK